MRVLFPMRSDALSKPGGDTVQVRRYVQELAVLGIAGEIQVDPLLDLRDFDLVHFTNLDRPLETLVHWEQVMLSKLPYVVTPIHHSYSEIKLYERLGRASRINFITRHLDFYAFEKIRAIVRGMTRERRWIRYQIKWIFRSIESIQTRFLENAETVLFLNIRERNLVAEEIGWSGPGFHVVPNGIELEIDPVENNRPVAERRFLCVGRIEARKNQLMILRAAKKIGVPVTFVGSANSFHGAYLKAFREELEDSASVHVEKLPRPEVLALMRQSKCHVSASWFEVASLVDIEAYISGCNIVASRSGGTLEVLGDSAEYCDPASYESLVSAMRLAIDKPTRAPEMKPQFLTWSDVASRLAAIYSEICG